MDFVQVKSSLKFTISQHAGYLNIYSLSLDFNLWSRIQSSSNLNWLTLYTQYQYSYYEVSIHLPFHYHVRNTVDLVVCTQVNHQADFAVLENVFFLSLKKNSKTKSEYSIIKKHQHSPLIHEKCIAKYFWILQMYSILVTFSETQRSIFFKLFI